MDQEKYQEQRDEIIQKIKEDGNQNLAEILEQKTARELSDEEKKESWIEIFPEFESEITAIQTKAQQYLKNEGEYKPLDYFEDNVHGNLSFQPKKMVDDLLKKFRFKYVEKRGLYVWNGTHWEKIEKNEEGLISREINKRLKNETQQNYRNNVKDILKSREEIKVSQEEFENPAKMIPFSNCVYDIEKNQKKEHKPEYNFTFTYNAKYDEEAESNGINKLVKDVAPESEAKRKKIKEILAIAIAPWKVNQKVPILHGQGANGKNQIVKTLFKIVGKENYHKTDAHSLQTDKFEKASLVDKQVAFFDEFEDVSKPGKLKGIVGDSEQKVREMQKESYTAQTSVYGIFAANELPNADDNSDGFYRRWEIIDFNQKFTDEENDGNPDKIDPWKLEQKYMTQEDLDSFATELVQHLKDVLERGKIKNQSTTEQTRRVWNRKSGNAVYAFIDRFLTQGDFSYDSDEGDNFRSNDWIAKDDLKEIVNEYMDFHNNSSIRKDQLTRALKAHPDVDVDESYRPRTEDGGRVMAYGGIKIKPDAVRDVNAISTSLRMHARGSLRKVNHRKWVDMVDQTLIKRVIMYLLTCENNKSNLFDLVRNVEIQPEDLEQLNQAEIIKIEQKTTDNQFGYPEYGINEERMNLLKERAEKIGEKDRVIVEKIKELDGGKGVDIQDVIEEVDFQESVVEKVIEGKMNEGELYEPEPGKVSKL